MEAPGKNGSGSFQACGGSASEGCLWQQSRFRVHGYRARSVCRQIFARPLKTDACF